MLHIITPLFRFDLINHVYNSIPKHDDITWHISKSNKREELNYEFLNDDRVRVYNVDCDDTDTTAKRNAALTNIKDGYFCFLDDDTIFHENMYIKYEQCVESNFIGMIIGEQHRHNGTLRLKATTPRYCGIDTGNVIAHTSCLKKCRWPDSFIRGVNQKDSLFWESVYNFFERKCGLCNSPISYYNVLKKSIKTKQ